MITQEDLLLKNRHELKELILSESRALKQRLDNGEDIDSILDKDDPFVMFEPFMSPTEYSILVIAMINNFQSEIILNTILDALEKGIQAYLKQRKNIDKTH